MLWPERRLCSDQLALFQGTRLGAAVQDSEVLAWSYSSVTENDQHAESRHTSHAWNRENHVGSRKAIAMNYY